MDRGRKRTVIRSAVITCLSACISLGGLIPTAGASVTHESNVRGPGAGPLIRVSAAAASTPPFDTSLLALINRLRLANGRRPLLMLADLNDRATQWSAHLRRVGALSHDAGLSSQASAVCSVRAIRENVAFADEATPRQLLANYVASPPHRANLLANDVRFIGLGTVTSHTPGSPLMLRYWNTMKFVGGSCPRAKTAVTRYSASSVTVTSPDAVQGRQLINLRVEVRSSSAHLAWVSVYFTSSTNSRTSLIAVLRMQTLPNAGLATASFSTYSSTSGTFTAVYGGGRTGPGRADLGAVARHGILVSP
jgi:uncharacterized protein YkwD